MYPGGGAWTQTTNGLRPEDNVYILDGVTAMEPLGGQRTINSVILAGDAAATTIIDGASLGQVLRITGTITVSLTNLTATSILLCAYTGRFIYPMLSLEGRKFWILGLLPLKRDRLLWGKFTFSATWALLIEGAPMTEK